MFVSHEIIGFLLASVAPAALRSHAPCSPLNATPDSRTGRNATACSPAVRASTATRFFYLADEFARCVPTLVAPPPPRKSPFAPRAAEPVHKAHPEAESGFVPRCRNYSA